MVDGLDEAVIPITPRRGHQQPPVRIISLRPAEKHEARYYYGHV